MKFAGLQSKLLLSIIAYSNWDEGALDINSKDKN